MLKQAGASGTQGELKYPWITTNENKTKHLLDNYYGTGQSTWDGVMRASSYFIAGKVCAHHSFIMRSFLFWFGGPATKCTSTDTT